MRDLNVINYTQFCVIVTAMETFLILYNCNLLKILSNYILNYTRTYNLFVSKPVLTHCGHVLKASVTCTK